MESLFTLASARPLGETAARRRLLAKAVSGILPGHWRLHAVARSSRFSLTMRPV
jgi:hypothetical protein